MSDPTAPEPTMEEILASIRRIISEDDKPTEEVVPEKAPEALAPPPAEVVALPPPAPAPVPEPVHAFEEDEEVLELTEPAPAHETHGDLEVFTPRVETPRPPPEPAPPPRVFEPEPDDDALLSAGVEDQVLSHFGRLSQTIAMPKSQRTLEDVVRELLRPLLTDWLDEHLPRIVEEKVQAEVERIARRRL